MKMFSQSGLFEPKELLCFMGYGAAEVPEDDLENWLQEIAVQIAGTGSWGLEFLLAFAPFADESRLRAILLGLSSVEKRLTPRQRIQVCELARKLLTYKQELVVAEAVDTLACLGCREATRVVSRLLHHSSPYVIGSA